MQAKLLILILNCSFLRSFENRRSYQSNLLKSAIVDMTEEHLFVSVGVPLTRF